jgi:hypothetical protein
MNTNRLETFADGVFAIAATLLIGLILFAAIAALYILESSLFGRTEQPS